MSVSEIKIEKLELIGEGGQGRVYRALRRDLVTGLEQVVALKILHSRTAVDLWRLEFQSLSSVRSPYCVRPLYFERVEGQPALVLEYIDGVSLEQLQQSVTLEPTLVTEVVAQIQTALMELNQQNLVHGDLSPHNIMIDRSGAVRLLDFGLANCAPHELRCTPRFSAPERLNGAPASLATDLFALGCVAEYLNPNTQFASYKCIRPEQRKALPLTPSSEAQSELSRVVEHARDLGRSSSKTRTFTIQRSLPRAAQWWRVACILLVGFMVNSMNAQSVGRANESVLSIRTEKWHYIILDGKVAGYAPMSIPISTAQDHILEWTSASGHGEKTIHSFESETIVLRDSDLSH